MIDEKNFMKFMDRLEQAGAEHICFDDLRKFVDEQPKIGEWIPCSERLPEEPFSCLVTIIDSHFNGSHFEDFENILPYFVGYSDGQWNDSDGEKIPF